MDTVVRGTMVVLEQGENIELGLKRFRRQVQKDQIQRDSKKREAFKTKGATLREKKAKAKKGKKK